jgi:hypothetical protein
MNFKPLFSIEENDVATRVYIPKDQNEFKIFAEQILVDGQPLELIYSENPVLPHHGTCPVCNGTKQVNSLPCNNCGGQYNDNNPRGTVLLNQNNTPCTHDYNSQVIRNNYTQFFCDSCGDVYFKNI